MRKKEREKQAMLSEQKHRRIEIERSVRGKIKDKFSNVKEINIEYYIFHDFRPNGYEKKNKLLKEDDWAFIEVSCFPSEQCTDGGYDLSDIINKMVSDNEQFKEDIMPCKGKITKYLQTSGMRCYGTLHFKITIN